MSTMSDRAVGLVGRVGAEERPRDRQWVALVMLDGTEIRGWLHRTPGIRTLDYLNHQADGFVAITDATLTRGERSEKATFVAINKAQVIRLVEVEDPG